MTDFASVRVLIVDEQFECEDVVSIFLRRRGNEVRTMFGGLFPMNEARDFAPELVMLHVGRPAFDALSLVKLFRRRHSFGSVPLVAMSSECDPESRGAGIAAGFDQWLVKPIPFEALSVLLADVRATISMPEGLVQRTIDNVARFDAMKLEQDKIREKQRDLTDLSVRVGGLDLVKESNPKMTQSASMPDQTAFVQPLTATEEKGRQIALVKTPHVELIQLIIPAGRDVPTHQAQGDLVVHCLEGRVSLLALGRTYDLTPGQLLQLSIDEPFSIRGIDNASVLMTLITAKTGAKVELIGD